VSAELHGYSELAEPDLAFDPTDHSQVAVNPLVGLSDYGPFSARAFATPPTIIRIALLGPQDDLPRLREQLNDLIRPHKPEERHEYLPDWTGFETVFKAKFRPADESAQIPLPTNSTATSPRRRTLVNTSPRYSPMACESSSASETASTLWSSTFRRDTSPSSRTTKPTWTFTTR
jgi:hypothetical protein